MPDDDGENSLLNVQFVRMLVKLEPGEVDNAIQLYELPEGYRLETDAEFRARILASI